MTDVERHEPRAAGTDVLNGLLVTERSAVGTYTHVIALLDDPVAIGELQKIRDDHRKAERKLYECVTLMHGTPAAGAGLWPALASAAPGAKAIGCATLLTALRAGEEFAIGAYEDALDHEDVHCDCHRLIGGELLPAARAHVDELNRLLGGTS